MSTTARVVNWNPQILRNRLTAALRDYRPVLEEQFRTEIQTSQFSWPRVTRRKNGTTVSSPRDIVDTGAFLRSQRSYQPAPLTLVFAWGISGGYNYAGNILRGDLKGWQPRNWIAPALEKRPLTTFLANRLR